LCGKEKKNKLQEVKVDKDERKWNKQLEKEKQNEVKHEQCTSKSFVSKFSDEWRRIRDKITKIVKVQLCIIIQLSLFFAFQASPK